jgi:hypothetical protein
MTCRQMSGLVVLGALCLVACNSEENSPGPSGVGGQVPGTGGSTAQGSGGAANTTSNSQTGGTKATGGIANSGGSNPSMGGSSTGGANQMGLGGSSTGGATVPTGGKATGGRSNAGGAATGGATGVGGMTTGGATATGGSANSSGGASIGGAATGGGSSTGLANFSFFVVSEAALISLSGNAKGFGGDLRHGEATGLAGADKICTTIAEKSMAGAGAKQWRAFLSIAANGDEAAVNAIDRVGNGPWYDRLGRVVSLTKAGLAANRPTGANSTIINDLPNESGAPNHSPNGTQVDNHDTLTGSNTSGQLASNYANTCNNWTSAVSSTGRPVLGHSWTANSGTNWIQVGHTGGGCAPCNSPTGQSGTSGTVGSMGGYGGFYCFALSP